MNPQTNPYLGLLTSRKTLRVLLGLVLIWGSFFIVRPSIKDQDTLLKSYAGAVIATATLLGVDIAGIAHEDAAAKSSPASQVNLGSNVTNAPGAQAADPAADPKPDPSPKPEPAPIAAAPSLTPEEVKQMVDDRILGLARKAKAQITDGQAVLSAITNLQSQTPAPLNATGQTG